MKTFLLFFFGIIILASSSFAQSQLWGTTIYGGNQWGTVYSLLPGADSLCYEYSFNGISDGHSPMGDLIQASDGKLYGLTQNGGINDAGVIFQFDPLTSTYTKKFDFSSLLGEHPCGSFIQANDGKLYAMTTSGGINGKGVIFQYDFTINSYVKKIDLIDSIGSSPYGNLIQANDGKLYGMTTKGGIFQLGAIFQYDIASNKYYKKIDLDSTIGCQPFGSLIQAFDGKLYGMTSNGGIHNRGVIFEYDFVSNSYLKKVDFIDSSGSYPYGSLLQFSDSTLYGMTSTGGLENAGVIFQYNPKTNIYTNKADFDSTNGYSPFGSLISSTDGKLYGMTSGDNYYGNGILFQYNPATDSCITEYDFGDYYMGANPVSSLMQANDGKFYGMTLYGGFNNRHVGVIFQYDPSSNVYTKKIDLGRALDGNYPAITLTQATNGKLYGGTYQGGSQNGVGVLFEIDPVTHTYTKKIELSSAIGYLPYGLTELNGKLYGTMFFGGTYDNGVIFEYDPSFNQYTVKCNSFGSASNPDSRLIVASDGNLYGTTFYGGLDNGGGNIFQYNPLTNICTEKFVLKIATGMNATGLMQASDGKLYGLCYDYGKNIYNGVIFRYDYSTNTYSDIFDFIDSLGSNPSGSLIQASDGKLYGMTYFGGAHDMGVIFQYDLSTNTYMKKIDLDSTTGYLGDIENNFSLMQASDGKLYGVASGGGIYNHGVVFQYDPLTNIYKKLIDFNYANGSYPIENLIEISLPTKVNEPSSYLNNINIYPNPFDLQTIIAFSEEQKNTTIKITDLLGKEIKIVIFTGKQLTVEKGEMRSGIYFVQITDNKKNTMNRKIIVE